MAKARMVRDDLRGLKLSADGGFSGNDLGGSELHAKTVSNYELTYGSDWPWEPADSIIGLGPSRSSPPASPAGPALAVLASKLDYST